MRESDTVSLSPAADGEEAPAEHLGWGTFRPPPKTGLVFGAIYGALAGMFIAYDIAVLIRLGRIMQARIREFGEEHGAPV